MLWTIVFGFLILVLFIIISLLIYNSYTDEKSATADAKDEEGDETMYIQAEIHQQAGSPPSTVRSASTVPSLIAINPTQKEFAYVGIVTREATFEYKEEIHTTLPMKVLYAGGDKDIMMDAHVGCKDESKDITSPFIVECDDFEQGVKLVQEFYKKKLS